MSRAEVASYYAARKLIIHKGAYEVGLLAGDRFLCAKKQTAVCCGPGGRMHRIAGTGSSPIIWSPPVAEKRIGSYLVYIP